MTSVPERAPSQVVPPVPECWRRVGTSGDRSCRELVRFIHCRNCPVIADAARGFFERPAPPGYREAWQNVLEQPVEAASAALSLLIFRVADEWLAVPTTAVVEVATPRPIHPLPHRTGTPLLGVVSVRGQLHPAFSLQALLELSPATTDRPEAGRLLLIARPDAHAAGGWALAVDEVAAVQRIDRDAITPPPATVRAAAWQATDGLLAWQGRSVGMVDVERLLHGLESLVSGTPLRAPEPPPWPT
jgi:chemotaxis-related protein WspD